MSVSAAQRTSTPNQTSPGGLISIEILIVLVILYGTGLSLANEDLFRASTPVLASGLALWGVAHTVNQRRQADERAEWWRRTQWALERLEGLSESERLVSWSVLQDQLAEDQCRAEDLSLMNGIAAVVFARVHGVPSRIQRNPWR